MPIHPTAIVSPKAQIDPTVEVGPYAIIDGEVTIGSNCRIFPHVHIMGFTTIGVNNRIHTGAIIGDEPQDLAFQSDRSYVRIGDNNIIREYCIIHRGTAPESETVIGNNCFLMAGAHVAHNCRIGDHVKAANWAGISGYVQVDDGTFISGMTGIHQFVRIGRLCMVAGASRLTMDLPPFMMSQGESFVIGVNRVGLKRAGFTSAQIMDIRSAYRLLYRSGMGFSKAVEQLEQSDPSEYVKEIINFIRAPSKRGVAGPPPKKRLSMKEPNESD